MPRPVPPLPPQQRQELLVMHQPPPEPNQKEQSSHAPAIDRTGWRLRGKVGL